MKRQEMTIFNKNMILLQVKRLRHAFTTRAPRVSARAELSNVGRCFVRHVSE